MDIFTATDKVHKIGISLYSEISNVLYMVFQVSWIRKRDVVVLSHGSQVFTSDDRVKVRITLPNSAPIPTQVFVCNNQ